LVEQHEAEVAANILVFSLVAGLASGAAFSFVISPNIIIYTYKKELCFYIFHLLTFYHEIRYFLMVRL